MANLLELRASRGVPDGKKYEDPETGCSSIDEVAFQSCREAYFLKQQNQILQNQQPNPKPEESTQLKTETINANSSMLYVAILLVVVIATIFITKYLIKK